MSLSGDERWMEMAIRLARQGEGLVEPNPMVGCVLVRDDQCIGQGFHRQFGGPHAEVDAIRSVADAQRLRGATAYVTLEPCCHHGKTPPCTDAIIAAGIGRVVVAIEDPFPQVAGGGLRQLAANGIETQTGVLAGQAAEVLSPYLKLLRTGRPWVIAKWAMTIDGRIATRSGASQWITGESARREVHSLRRRVDAIAVGVGTVIADDPLLTARPAGAKVAKRVVYSGARLPPLPSRLVQTAHDVPLVIVAGPSTSSPDLKLLRDAGAHVLVCDSDDPRERIAQSLDWLGQGDGETRVTNLMLEGGAGLLGSYFDARAIDECHVYIGAKAFGGAAAMGPIAGQGVAAVHEHNDFRLLSVERFDDDVRLIYRKTQA